MQILEFQIFFGSFVEKKSASWHETRPSWKTTLRVLKSHLSKVFCFQIITTVKLLPSSLYDKLHHRLLPVCWEIVRTLLIFLDCFLEFSSAGKVVLWTDNTVFVSLRTTSLGSGVLGLVVDSFLAKNKHTKFRKFEFENLHFSTKMSKSVLI